MLREVPDEPAPECAKREVLLFSGQVHLFHVATPSYRGPRRQYPGLAASALAEAGSETPRMRNGRPSPRGKVFRGQEEWHMPTRTHFSDCLAAR